MEARESNRNGEASNYNRPADERPADERPVGDGPVGRASEDHPVDRPDGERVLVLSPTGRDSGLIAKLLTGRGVTARVCPDMDALCAAVAAGAGAALIAEEALTDPALRCLLDYLGRQPAWSELPVIVLTAPGFPSRFTARLAEQLEPSGNVTHVERPVRPLTLASTVRSALRARRRQYQVRDLLAMKEAAIAEHREAVRQRDEFLAMLGHELRNPLATIGSCLSVLDELGWDAESVDEQRPVLARQTRHLGRLVDDLLDVARITKGTIALRKSPLDLGELARRCVAAQAEQYRAAGVGLSVGHTGSSARPVLVDGDAVRLEQVVTNLLTNAAKFTPAGQTVRVSVRAEGDRAVVTVADTGLGIPPEMLARIFDLFAQAHASIDRNRGGLGLGLTIVRRLVELHGGTVTAHSDGPGRGSTFTARLPLHAPAAAAVDGRPAGAAANGRRVLLVEDNPDARLVLRRLLRLWGHDVETAEDGPQGLDKARSLKPDVVLLDIGLPGLDGYEVARRLRSDGPRDLCLIAVTGYGQADDCDRALAAGFNAHMVKPVDPTRLSQLIAGCRAA